MEAVHGLKGPNLDLIIHSPGGSVEATEALVAYLRSKFEYIRIIIPHAAMSAATMWSCSANEVVMANHSFLGPTDAQFILDTNLGNMSVPTQAILDQFELAKKDYLENPGILGVWWGMLEQYGPALLKQCMNASDLTKLLVGEWLETYMFAGEADAKKKAGHIATYLTNHEKFKSHGRHISRKDAEDVGLKITKLEDDQKLQDAVLSVYHSMAITFMLTSATKIIENHLGARFIKTNLGRDPLKSDPTKPIRKRTPKKKPRGRS